MDISLSFLDSYSLNILSSMVILDLVFSVGLMITDQMSEGWDQMDTVSTLLSVCL